jgi:hypothetical protein
MSSQPVVLTVFVTVLAFTPHTVRAQVSTASINGTMRDSSGSTVPSAVVTLHNVDTAMERTTVTNNAGAYVFLNVVPGNYTLEMSKAGFNGEKIASFTLEVNQTATFDATLRVGSVQESVVVTAVGAAVQSSTSELGAVVSTKQVSDLPLNGRNFTQLLSLTPGVSPIGADANSGGGTQRPIGDFTFPAVNGQPNRSNFFMLDGINNQGALRNTYAVPPVIDGVQEFKVQSHNDEAAFGGVLGGIINVVSKSGTNALHGAAWEFLRNDAFDARNFFLNSVTPFKQNQFGIAAGGPVVLPRIYNGHNRTFFYLDYQGYRFRQAAGTLYRVPTPANLTGDLSDQPLPIFNPYTTRPNSNGTGFIRDPFPGNQIPASLLDPTSLGYAKATLPAPIGTGIPNRNQIDNTPIQNDEEDYSARVDQMIRNKDFVWFRYSGLLQNYQAPAGRQTLRGVEEHRAKNIGISWVHTFGPSSVLEVQYGRVTMRDDTRNHLVGTPANFAEQIGFSDQYAGNFLQGAVLTPAISVPDFFSGGELNKLFRPSNIHEAKTDYSHIHGNHTFKAGASFDSNTVRIRQQYLDVNFGVIQTGNPQSPGNTGSALASFLLNLPDSADRNDVVQSVRWGGTIASYFQDQWKASSRLTINLGIRYDHTFVPPYGTTADDNIATGGLDLRNGTYIIQVVPPPCAVKQHAPCIPTPDGSLAAHITVDPRGEFFHNTTKNLQPRVGLAYRLRPGTAIRASFGIFFDEWSAIAQRPQNLQGQWPGIGAQSTSNLNAPSSAQPTPTIKGVNPFPGGSTLPPPNPFSQQQVYVDPLLQNPYSMQWNLGIQHQINTSTVVTANYVGSGTRRLSVRSYQNTAPTPGPGDPQSRAPYPYIRPTSYDWDWGKSDYDALQLLLEKRYSNGLAMMISYTYSKVIDIGCSGFLGATCYVQDPYHFNTSRGVAGFDLTHMLVANWVYELPVGKGRRFQTSNHVADYVLGNWQLNGITTVRSGPPYTVTVAGDIANIGAASGYMRPNLVGDANLASPTPSQWFNTAAFASPALYTFGNLGRDTFRSDWVRNFDLSVFRQFRLMESKLLEFRTESFNIFNTPTFAAPTNSLSSPTFGRVLSTANHARQLQFSLKLIF